MECSYRNGSGSVYEWQSDGGLADPVDKAAKPQENGVARLYLLRQTDKVGAKGCTVTSDGCRCPGIIRIFTMLD